MSSPSKTHSAAPYWLLFGAGGMACALFGPALVFVTGLAWPLGWGEGASYERVLALLRPWPAALAAAAMVSLSAWHAAHRIVHVLHDLGMGGGAGTRRACYSGALALSIAAGLALLVSATAHAADAPAAAQSAAPQAAQPQPTPKPGHRPLRQNVPDAGLPEATEPEKFAGIREAIPFSVVPQKPGLTMFPCSQCHGPMPPNPEPRLLNAPHNSALKHGGGRLWCLTCHDVDDRDHLHTVRGEKVDFDDAYLVCGQCHSARQRDWYLGGHGKRSANWRGERVVYNCTHCHDPHDPKIKPRKPSPPPPVRAGLTPMKTVEEHDLKVWERHADRLPEATR